MAAPRRPWSAPAASAPRPSPLRDRASLPRRLTTTLAQPVDRGLLALWVTENKAPRDQHGGAVRGRLRPGLCIDAAVHFDVEVRIKPVTQGARCLDPLQAAVDEFLTAPAGVDAHHHQQVGVLEDRLDERQRTAGVEANASPQARLADTLQHAVDVPGRLDMHR